MKLHLVGHANGGHSVMWSDRVVATGNVAGLYCLAARVLQSEGLGDAVLLEYYRGDHIVLRGRLGDFARLSRGDVVTYSTSPGGTVGRYGRPTRSWSGRGR